MKGRFLIASVTGIVFATALLMPARKAEANEAVAGIVGGMVGLMVGSALQANANHQRCCSRDRQVLQRHLMKEVLQNYDPSYHSLFEEYVLIDLEGWLTTRQQQQLLDIMAQRHFEGCGGRLNYHYHCIR